MAHGYVVSDLHLFTPWSGADDYLSAMHTAAAGADFFVLNGDVVDFRWSDRGSVEATADAAVAWVRELAGPHPDCRFVYVMGNHDRCRLLADGLKALGTDVPNVEARAAHARIGAALFVHGDLFLTHPAEDPLAPELRGRMRQPPTVFNRAYGTLHAMRGHRALRLVFWKRWCASRIRRALGSAEAGLTDVYFGHTHVPFADYRHGPLAFHNTGSAIRGLRWNMLRVDDTGAAAAEEKAAAGVPVYGP
jgi:UDP-2,3-diacylglucosamine hydrolase